MHTLVDLRLLGRGGTSGIEEYSRNLIENLMAADPAGDYSFFYNGFRKQPLAGQLSEGAMKRARLIDWNIPNKLLDLSGRFFNFPEIGRLLKADLIFSPHFNLLSAGKTPRVITFHDLSFLHHPYFFSRRQRFWHWLQNIRGQAEAASHLIAVSEFTKSDLMEFLGIPSEKISVIYPGISDIFQNSLTHQSINSSTRPYILYLGTVEPRKNVQLIIRAFNLLKEKSAFRDWQLVIAGRLGWLYQEVLREARRSLFSSDIIFRGAVGSEERVSLYNLAEVFIYPSFFEGFGFPPLEAQASGCPAIVSDRTSLPEVLGASALYVNPWKAGELAESVENLVMNTALKNRLVADGLINAARFRWEDSATQTLQVFNQQ